MKTVQCWIEALTTNFLSETSKGQALMYQTNSSMLHHIIGKDSPTTYMVRLCARGSHCFQQ